MNKKLTGHKVLAFALLSMMLTAFLTVTALAEGWVKNDDGSVSYMVLKKSGKEKAATGLQKIDGKTFYFDENGVMQTGFVRIENKVYYFKAKGKLGTVGSMLTGWKNIYGRKYYFNTETGVMATGLKKIGKYTYFFSISSKLGTRGMVLKDRFRTYKNKTYYLNTKGHMVRNKWINGRYLGSDGVMLVSTVTPDGWLVNANGEKVKKVSDGASVEINGKTYTWNAETGKLNRTRILIVAGHGQGDSGAVGVATEAVKTREFAALIYKYLSKYDNLDVTYYMNGSTSYDLYQRNKALLPYGSVTGSGAKKSTLITYMNKYSSVIPVLSDYDYVLEVHFNATGYASKDLSGDGNYKGLGFYVNSYRTYSSSFTIERNICSKIQTLGFKIWGGGVLASSTLLNARLCQEVGTDYALIETAFIDDADDMKFYNSKKSKMAKAIAACISAYYS